MKKLNIAFIASQKKYLFFVLIVSIYFSIILFFNTFRINHEGNIEIYGKLWSDFASTIPLIRSFSLGNNFPPQYPLFAGPPIRYHFGFYAIVGLLEKIGLGIDFSLNLPSAISFSALLIIIYKFASLLFKSKAVGFLSMLMFLFNGSLSFIEYFKKYPGIDAALGSITSNKTFPSFGPYDGKIVSAFWNLNIYTNQRHLAFAYFAFILLIFFIYKKYISKNGILPKETVITGVLVGLFPFFHLAIFFSMGVAILLFFIILPKIRKGLFFIGLIALAIAVPQILYMGKSYADFSLFNPGYLIEDISLFSFIRYWIYNLGLGFFLIPLGFILSEKNQRKMFLPFFSLFVIANTFQFSPEIAANHKFFNLFIIGANMFSAHLLIMFWKKKLIGKIITLPLLFFLILSGIIDFFPIINDKGILLRDIPNNAPAKFIAKNTDKNSVFLTSSFLYHPSSIAGRKIFLGWPYFAWSAGYDTNSRYKILKEVYSSNDKKLFCEFLNNNSIDYFTVENTFGDSDLPEVDLDYFIKNFEFVYEDDDHFFYIGKRVGNCT